jgi:hypothetical protein
MVSHRKAELVVRLTRCEEVRGSEVPEHCKTVGENTECAPEYTPDREVWLKATEVDELCAVDALNLKTLIEPKIRDV